MPQPEVYGASPPLELLRQCLDARGFYDRKKMFWNSLKDIFFLAVCGPPGGGRNKARTDLDACRGGVRIGSNWFGLLV